jgi:hypothetical protein
VARKATLLRRKVFGPAARAFELAGRIWPRNTKVGMVAYRALGVEGSTRSVAGCFNFGPGVEILA